MYDDKIKTILNYHIIKLIRNAYGLRIAQLIEYSKIIFHCTLIGRVVI